MVELAGLTEAVAKMRRSSSAFALIVLPDTIAFNRVLLPTDRTIPSAFTLFWMEFWMAYRVA